MVVVLSHCGAHREPYLGWGASRWGGGFFVPDPCFFPLLEEQRVPCWASMSSEVVEDEFEFYSKAEKYWKDVPATVDGMLGGYGHISSIDINSSRKFLQRFLRVGNTGPGAPKSLFLLLAWSWALPSGLLLLGCLAVELSPSWFSFPGWSQQDGDDPSSGLRGGHRPHHQVAAAAPLQDGGHGGRDGGFPHQGQELPGRGGQAGAQLLLLRPPGLQP